MTEGLNNTEVKEYIVLPVICLHALLPKLNFYVVKDMTSLTILYSGMRCILESKSFDIRQKDANKRYTVFLVALYGQKYICLIFRQYIII